MNKNEGSNTGLLILGIGIGSIVGVAVGALLANSQKETQPNSFGGFGKNNRTDLRNSNYEFGLEYGVSGGQSGSLKDEDKILYGHGMNYGVSGYGSGIHDSQTNVERRKSSNKNKSNNYRNSVLDVSHTGYGYVSKNENDDFPDE